MAVTKILARKGGLNDAIRYIVNGDKTNGQTLTAYLNCDPGHAARQMQDTKESVGKTDGVQYYRPSSRGRLRRNWLLKLRKSSRRSIFPALRRSSASMLTGSTSTLT